MLNRDTKLLQQLQLPSGGSITKVVVIEYTLYNSSGRFAFTLSASLKVQYINCRRWWRWRWSFRWRLLQTGGGGGYGRSNKCYRTSLYISAEGTYATVSYTIIPLLLVVDL